jgi:hypothetical protein
VVAGRFTKEGGVSFGFLYLYDYNECRVKRTYEFPSINQGFTDISFQRGMILAVGYHQFKKGKQQEVIVIGTVEKFLTMPKDAKDWRNAGSLPLMFRASYRFLPADKVYDVLPQAAFIRSDFTVIVVS